MTSKGTTNLFKEKKILQEEEKSLKLMLERFQDQQNRLKIEELALSHLLRMQQSKKNRQDIEGSSKTFVNSEINAYDHNIGASNLLFDSEDDQESQLSDMIPVGHMEIKKQEEEDVHDINQQILDLHVPHSSGIYHTVEVIAEGLAEEEEFDSDDTDEENLGPEHSVDPLRGFIDDL